MTALLTTDLQDSGFRSDPILSNPVNRVCLFRLGGELGFAHEAAIQICVVLSRARAGKFPLHGATDQTGPKSAIREEELGAFNRVPKRIRRIVVAKKAVAGLRRRE